MSRRRRKGRKERSPRLERRSAVAAITATARARRRRVALWAGAGVVLAVAGVATARLLTSRPAFPEPPRVPASGTVSYDDFTGAETCAECHAAQYDVWRTSTHGRAGGPPGPDLVIARFDGRPIRFADAVVTPSVDARGGYRFTVEQSGRDPQVFVVSGVIGGGHMVAGGTQGFVSDFPDGTVRFLPFDFIRREGVWFCNTNTRTNRGWIPITRDVLLAECADWPPVRILGSDVQFANCQECHGSQIQVQFDTASRRYATRVTSLAINCESCHGPGRSHVDRMRSGTSEADLGMRALATLSEDESLEVCFQCHALKDVLQPGYLPGQPLEDHFSISFPLLGDHPLFPDGRVRTFAYQANHRYSDCYLNGSMTCVDCHDPHSQQYRDIWGGRLDDRLSDGQCTDCHASKALRPEAHTHHPAASTGSRCVSCHMPYLQHPELGHALGFARSDHTISIPRPALDERLGIVGACSTCHGDRPVAELARDVERWYGALKPLPPLVRALFRVDELAGASAAAAALLDPATTHAVAQVAALGLLVERYLAPDMPVLDAEIERALEQLAAHRDLDVRAVALAALHLVRGEHRATRAMLARRLRDAGPSQALATRWVIALGTFGDRYLADRRVDDAIMTYGKALEIRPGDPALLTNLGLARTAARDFPGAVASFRQALLADSSRALTWVNLGLALEGSGDATGAAAAYRNAMMRRPDEALPHFNLANIFLRARDLGPAITHYRAALERDPGLAQARFYLARALAAGGDLPAALAETRAALRFAPNDAPGRDLEAQLEAALGGH